MPWNSQVVIANQVIIIGANDGMFVYNGAPTTGNLIVSAAGTAGTDPYGNAYPQGLNVTQGVIVGATIETATSGTRLVLDNSGSETMYDGSGNVLMQWSSSASTFTVWKSDHSQYIQFGPGAQMFFQPENDGNHTPGSITPLKGIGAFDLPQMVLTSPCGTAFGTVAKLVLGGAGTDINQSYARLTVSNGATIDTYWTKAGESWQTPTLGSGWAVGPQAGTFQPIAYRRDIEDNIIIRGAVHTTSATPASVIFNLAASWHPGSNWRGPGAVCNNGGTATVCYLEVDSNGNVSISPNEAASGNDVYFMAMIPAGVIT